MKLKMRKFFPNVVVWTAPAIFLLASRNQLKVLLH